MHAHAHVHARVTSLGYRSGLLDEAEARVTTEQLVLLQEAEHEGGGGRP